MQLIPPALVPAVQMFLQQQGTNPNIFNSSGEIDAAGVVGAFFNQVEVRTSVTPSLIFPISSGGPPGNPMMQNLVAGLQPTVIFRGPAGEVAVAPYGSAQGASSWLPIALVGGAVILGIGWLVWK